MPIRTRLLAALATWTLLFLASPGILSRDGAAVLALVALVPWALWCSRPGPRAFAVEWLAAGIGLSALMIWSTYVWWGTLLAVAIVPAFYVALAGILLRRLARRFPLALAAPAAWVALETLRILVEPPFGFGWLRLGTYFHASEWIAGSARTWGTGGISWAAAAFAGGIAGLVAARLGGRAATSTRSTGGPERDLRAGEQASPRGSDETDAPRSATRSGRAERTSVHLVDRERSVSVPRSALALGPLALAVALSLTTSAPATVDGPRVMLVQPSFEQRRKMEPTSAVELFRDSLLLTGRGIEAARAAGERLPDLVAWGETMFPAGVAGEGLLAAWDRGARPVDWARDALERHHIERMRAIEAAWVANELFGRRTDDVDGVLPGGTSFLSGVELYTAEGNDIRRRNAVVLWNAAAERAGFGGKIHLVPGAESLCGLERIGWVRDLAQSIAGYLPDILAFDETSVLTLQAREGDARWRFGVSVCFDNAYDGPYTEPVRRGPLDFHLVVSNEAWYLESFEYDQMVAFSRMIALQTGRSIVRATNAGVSVVIAPDGHEVERLAIDGRDRMVAGTLRATVPVPAAGETTPPLYVRSEHAWLALWIGLPLVLALAVRRGRGYSTGSVG